MVESSSPNGSTTKRNRDAEDEAYLDNFHSHKRYLSEIMASSLNGLTVGESMSENLIESPARSDATSSYLRDEISLQYSPMLEECDDGRYSEAPLNTTSTSMAASDSLPTSPSSPHRHHHQRPRQQQRGGCSDSEVGRFPSSPSDICHSADLRRAALLRSVQMRVQPPPPLPDQDGAQHHHPLYISNLFAHPESQLVITRDKKEDHHLCDQPSHLGDPP